MEHRFLTKEFKLIGVEEKINFYEDFTEIIVSLQERLFNEVNNIKNMVNDNSYIAYWYRRIDQSTINEEPDTYYFAAVEVNEIEDIPDGLKSKVIPKSEYVVFNEKRRGEVGGPEGYAYTSWLPNSGRELNNEVAGDLEVYHSRDNIGYESECEIYIPIK